MPVQGRIDFDGIDLSGIELGDGRYLQVVDLFKYLGSMLTGDCRDTVDVDARIKKASAAFGALRDCLFSSKTVSNRAKCVVYVGLVLAILLHGSECWCLTEVLFNRLRSFHARCVRAMCRVTRKHVWKHHIRTTTLLRRISLESIDSIVSQRQLRWTGHVARMPMSRLPRKIPSSWTCSKRPKGAPQMTYGRSLNKALKKADIPNNFWHRLAQDRSAWWRSTITENLSSVRHPD